VSHSSKHILLLGAGFTRNWGAPLASEVSGSLLGELHDDAELARRLRSGPFEDTFAEFQRPRGNGADAKRLGRLQDAITALFARMNAALATTKFEFDNDLTYSMQKFLERFDAIFTLNQDLLLEIHYLPNLVSTRWSGVAVPGMQGSYALGWSGPDDPTKLVWQPTGEMAARGNMQPYFKLHGSSNWQDGQGEPVLIMGSAKSGAIDRFPILKAYHDVFRQTLSRSGAKLMVIGYSFQDDHINHVISDGSNKAGLGTFLVDPAGRDVLKDPKMAGAQIRGLPRAVEEIKIIGELKRPLSAIFRGDVFAHGELMRFFT
jgi:hypothetical protein